jgi:putative DNA primase/helicase
VKPISKVELASRLGITLPAPYETNGQAPHTTAASGTGAGMLELSEPVDLENYPQVRAARDRVSEPRDRSKDTDHIVRACDGDSLTRAQARWVVNTRPDLAERLARRNDDDVGRIWDKIDTERRKKAQLGFWGTVPAPGNGQAAVDTGAASSDSADDAGGDGKVTHSAHLGMAVKMAKQFANKLLYVHGYGWHRWDGKRWAPDRNGAARRAVHTVIRRERAKAAKLPLEEREKRAKQLARYETASAISGILTEAAVLEQFSVELSDIDADPWLFNCQDGTLDLRTMELRDHNPADRITRIANAAYRTDSIGAYWREFLQKVLPDADVRGYTQRLIGLSLLGEVNGDKQIAPIATGSGANGKTTFTEAVSFALGDYAMPAEPTLLMAKRGDAHPTGIADLKGKRFVSVVETEQGRRLDIALLKWLTGGDMLKARFMRQNFFHFKPSHLLMMATNHLPRIDDDTEAVWRRIRVIPFTVQIRPAERNKHLKDQLCAEADAVLSWVIEGWKDYRQRGGLDEPDAVLIATNDYKGESDAVGRYVEDECLTGGAQSAATTRTLYERWQRWAAQDGCPPLSMIAFGRALDAKGYPTDPKDHDRRRRGICLNPRKTQNGQADEHFA